MIDNWYRIKEGFENAISIFNQYPSTQNSSIELELRFGNFINSKKGYQYFPKVSVGAYNRVRDFCKRQNLQETVENNTIESMNYTNYRIRKTTTHDYDGGEQAVKWEAKQRIQIIDVRDYGVRFAISRESKIAPYDYFQPDQRATMTTQRTRYSLSNVGFVDLTIVYGKDDESNTYRIEVEMNPLIARDERGKQRFIQLVEKIYKLILDTRLLYSVETKNQIINSFNKLLGSDNRYYIDREVVTHARPIKYHDIVWGGLVGNEQTNYRVAHKTDGKRVFLFIWNSNIWLLNLVGEVNRLFELSTKINNNTILDCEYVNLQQRLIDRGAPKVPYWLFLLDGLVIQGTDIRQNTHDFRLRKTQPLIDLFKANNLLNIYSKQFLSIDRPESLFSKVDELYSFTSDLDYKLSYRTDGFVFVPNNTAYVTHYPNPDTIPLRDRKLTKIPEIVKWKPVEQITIDLLVQKDKMGKIVDLYTSKRSGGKTILVKFEGSSFFPFTISMLEINDVIESAVSGNVVEFAFDTTTKKMIAVGIRYDKINPNRYDVAMDNWKDISDPIPIDVLRGRTLKLMRKYHNRVKNALFERVSAKSTGNNILDIGSGRGGDITKMRKYGFDKMLLVEPDIGNVAELISRLHMWNISRKVVVVLKRNTDEAKIRKALENKENNKEENKDDSLERVAFVPEKLFGDISITGDIKTVVFVSVGEDHKSIVKISRKFFGGPASIISMMFSLSFFWESGEKLEALAETIRETSAPGTQVVFATIDGDAVEQVFRPMLGGLEVNVLTDPQNTIKLKYDDYQDILPSPSKKTSSPKEKKKTRTYIPDVVKIDGKKLNLRKMEQYTKPELDAVIDAINRGKDRKNRVLKGKVKNDKIKNIANYVNQNKKLFEITEEIKEKSAKEPVKEPSKRPRPTLEVTLRDTIIGDEDDTQTEWLVRITDLEKRLENYGFNLNVYQRLQDEYLLTPAELRYTQLMYGGVMTRGKSTVDMSSEEIRKKADLLSFIPVKVPSITKNITANNGETIGVDLFSIAPLVSTIA